MTTLDDNDTDKGLQLNIHSAPGIEGCCCANETSLAPKGRFSNRVSRILCLVLMDGSLISHASRDRCFVSHLLSIAYFVSHIPFALDRLATMTPM